MKQQLQLSPVVIVAASAMAAFFLSITVTQRDANPTLAIGASANSAHGISAKRSENIAHHLRAMKRARAAKFGRRVNDQGLTGFRINQDAEREYEFHRRRLVELGYYFHREFDFGKRPDGGHGRLWRRIIKRFPNNDHLTLSWPHNVLSVWDRLDRLKQWEEFYREQKRPDDGTSKK